MSNTLFKKVAASGAALSIVMSIVSPVVWVQAADDVIAAANRLAALNIIVDNSKDPTKYNVWSKITRREMLKVMMNLSSVEVGTTCEWKFTDLKKSDWGCPIAESALKAWFIAANKKFRPDDNVTEAEALKMLMQAKGIAPKTVWTDWVKSYAEAAVEAGILTEAKVSWTNAAKRSFVFTTADTIVSTDSDDSMAEEDTEEEEDDLSGLLGDLLGDKNTSTMTWTTMTGTVSTGTVSTWTISTGTVSTGTVSTWTTSTGVVWIGNLEATLNPASLANGTQIPSTWSILFWKVDFSATKADISLSTVDFKSLGLASVPTSTRIWFEKNGKRLSSKAAFSSERNATVSFAPSYVIKAGTTETLDVYVELDTVAGSDFQFSGKVAASSAATTNGEFKTNTLRTANYKVAPIAFETSGTWNTVTQSDSNVEIGQFKVTNQDTNSETRDVKFQSITLRQNGNGDLIDLSGAILEKNWVQISTETIVSGKDITFIVNDTIKDGATAMYYVKAKVVSVQNSNGDIYNLSLKNSTDLNAIEVYNGFRSTVNNGAGSVTLGSYTINGADVVFARDTTVELSKTYAKWSDGVVFMQGTINAKTPVTLENPVIMAWSWVNLWSLFTTLYLQIGSSTISWSADSTNVAKFNWLATINGATKVKLYAKLRDTAPNTDVKFEDLKLTSFTNTSNGGRAEYVSNQNLVSSSVGSIPWVQVSIGDTKLTVTRTDGLGLTTVAPGSSNVLANEVSLSLVQGNDVQISNPTYTITWTGNYANNVYANLYVDGVIVDSKTVTSNTVTFSNLSKKVTSSGAVKLAVRLNLSDAYTAWDISVALSSLNAVDALTSSNVIPTYPTAATLTIAKWIATIAASDLSPNSQLVTSPSYNQKLFAYKITATNDDISLKDMVFTWTGLNNISNVRILNANNTQIGTPWDTTSTSIKFTNLDTSANSKITKDSSVVFYVVADINNNTNATWVTLTTDFANSTAKGSNWSLIALNWVNITSNITDIAENTAKIASLSSTKDLATDALKFSITATGKTNVVLKDIKLKISTTNYSTGEVVIVKASNGITVATLGTLDNSIGTFDYTWNFVLWVSEDIQKDANAKAAALAAAQADADTKSGSLADAKATATTKSGELATAQADANTKAAAKAAAQTDATAKAEEVALANANFISAIPDINTASWNLATAKSNYATAQATLTTASGANATAQATLATATTENNAAQATLTTATTANTNAQAKLSAASEANNIAQAKLSAEQAKSAVVVDASTTTDFIVKVKWVNKSEGTVHSYSVSLENLNINTWKSIVDLKNYPLNSSSFPLTSNN